jgi:hypothetical protein
VHPRRFDPLGSMTAEDDIWPIPANLTGIPHTPLLNPDLTSGLNHVDAGLQAAGRFGSPGPATTQPSS